MNLIKNFFHAFGDIIFGLIVVGVAVFLIGTQINNDFDVFALGNKVYDTVMVKMSGDNPDSKPAEILSEPGAKNMPVTELDEDNGSSTLGDDASAVNDDNNATVPPITDTVSKDDEAKVDTATEPTDIVSAAKPEVVPEIRNIEISAGSTAEAVASGLFANGIIGSKEEFLAEYARLPAGRSIIGGKFQIASGSTPSEILAIIAP